MTKFKLKQLLKIFVFCSIFVFIASVSISLAQISGTKTIDSGIPTGGNNYNNFTDAITEINTSGIGAGGVVFNVTAGLTFNENPPVLNATGTVSDQIVFQKTGVGANPKITPLTPGTIAPSTTLGSNGDGIMIINGGDYVTFDAIDIQENNSFTGNGKFEYGYYTKKASGTNACKNVTIKNCSVALNSVVGGAVIYSAAIFISNISGTVPVTVTSTGGRSENIKIFNNTVTKAYVGIHLRGYLASAPYDFYDQNIEVGVDGANSITGFGGGATTAYGFYAVYQNNVKIANNVVNGGASSTGAVYGIFTSTGVESNIDIYGNTVTVQGASALVSTSGINNGMGSGSTNTVNIYNNIITGCSNPSSTAGDMSLCYNIAPAGKCNMYGNTVTNNSLPGTGTMYSVYQAGTVVDSVRMYNNTVFSNSKSSTGLLYGVYNASSPTAKCEIYNNTVYSNSTSGGTIYGVNVATALLTNVYKNKVYSLSSTVSTGAVNGISVQSGTVTTNIYNNLIGNLTTSAANSVTDAIRGINLLSTTGSSSINVSNNTIYLNATSSGTNFSTTGIFQMTSPAPTSATFTSKNNLIVNISTPKGSGVTAAYRRSTNSLTNYGGSSNNNLYYAGVPGPSRLIYYDGTNSDHTLELFKERVAPRDSSSLTENAALKFISTTGSSPDFLHINTNIGTSVESNALSLAEVPDDFDGNARYPNVGYPVKSGYAPDAPDIGADEFGGLPPIFILYTALNNNSNLTSRQFTATITNKFGLANGSNAPRLYYKKSSQGSYAFDGAPVQAGNDFTFTINYSNVGGVTQGDIIQYYVAAQDVNGYTETSPFGGSGSNPPGTTAPGSVSQYTIVSGFAGTFSVGTSQTYSTITAAVTALNASEVSGPVIFNLTDSSYPSEIFPITINQIPGASSSNTITIRPANGVNTQIINSTSTNMFVLNGADYIRFEGSNVVDGAESMLIRNSSASAPAILFQSDASNNIIDGTTIESNNTNTVSGIIMFGTSLLTTGSDNNIIRNNNIKSITTTYPSNAIYSFGTNGNYNSANSILNNNIFDFSTNGIFIAGTGNGDNWKIKGNSLYYTGAGENIIQTAINFLPGLASNNNSVDSNFIGSNSPGASGTPWQFRGNGGKILTGIRMSVGNSTASTINKNIIKGFQLTRDSSAHFYGITLTGTGVINCGTGGANLVGGPTANEIISNAGGSVGTLLAVTAGISDSTITPGSSVISNNIVQNLAAVGTGTQVGLRGITKSNPCVWTCSNNTIFNLRSEGSSTAALTSVVLGIHSTASSAVLNIESNIIYNLEASHLTANTNTQGIIVASSTSGGTIKRNKIYDLRSLSTSPVSRLAGINLRGGTWEVSNNQITLNPTTDARVSGIFDSASTATAVTSKIIYNTVYIAGNTSLTSTNNSYGFLRSNIGTTNASSNMYIRDNIFYNERTGGTGFHYSIGNIANTSVLATGWSTQASEYNFLVSADTTRTGLWGTTNYSFNQWKANTLGDFTTMNFMSSIVASSLFTNTSTGDLNINTANSDCWYLNGAATQLTTPLISIDYNSGARSTTIAGGATDIGSDEFIPVAAPPAINVPVSVGSNNFVIGGKQIGTINIVNNGGGSLTNLSLQFYSGSNPPNPPATTLYGNGYVIVTPNGGASGYSYDISFFYTDEVLGSITGESHIRLAKSDDGGATWTPYLTAGTGAGQYQLDEINNVITVFGLTSFSIFALTDDTNPLPVELSSFTASADRNKVKLNWSTVSEINNSGFDIERKLSNENGWAKISHIAGNGTSNLIHNYSFEDRNLLTGKYGYRLKQIDFNGNFEYLNLSSEVEVGVPKEFMLSQNYPNPFNPSTKINYDLPFDSRVSIMLYDMSGREISTIVNTVQKAGYYTAQFTASNIASGIYFYRIIADGNNKNFVLTKKMVLVK